jgi:hypothetical protein
MEACPQAGHCNFKPRKKFSLMLPIFIPIPLYQTGKTRLIRKLILRVMSLIVSHIFLLSAKITGQPGLFPDRQRTKARKRVQSAQKRAKSEARRQNRLCAEP